MKFKTDKSERHKDGPGHHHPMRVFPLQRGHPHSALPLQPGRTLPALVFPSRVLSTSKVSRSPFFWIDARGLQCGDVQKYVRAAGVVSDETVTAFGIPHFQFSGRHRVLFPLRLQPGHSARCQFRYAPSNPESLPHASPQDSFSGGRCLTAFRARAHWRLL